MRRRTALFGMLVVLAVMLAALVAPLVAPFDPLEQDIGQRLREPGWQDAQGRVHPLGTDHLGRDILSRIVFGSRIALVVGSRGRSRACSAWSSGSWPATSVGAWTTS